MTARVQHLRLTTTNQTPAAAARPTGELWVNYPDRRIGFIDSTKTAQDLLGVRRHAVTATYALGDFVFQGGQLYRAKTALTPKAFTASDWDQLIAQPFTDGRYLQLTGGTISGPLAVTGTTSAQAVTATTLTTTGNITAGGTGITYANVTPLEQHQISFGWTSGNLLNVLVDNTNIGQLATRSFVTLGYLPLTGGTISGNLSTSGSITSGAGINANSFNLSSAIGYQWGFFVQSGTGDHYVEHRAQWWDVWRSSDGARYWTSPSGNLMVLDAAGDLTTTGYVMAPQFWVASGGVGQFGLTPGASGRIVQFQSGFYLDFSTIAGGTAGTLQYVVSNGPLWVMRASDDFCFNPQSNVGGNGAYLNISDRRAKTGIVPTTKGLAEIMQLQPVEFDRQNPATGTVHEIGFIAQDVRPVVPEAVWQAGIPLRDGSGGLDSGEPTLAMSESTITALNVNAIKELNAMLLALTDRIAALEAAP